MRLREYLDRRGESQAAFAARASALTGDEISQRTISRVCRGDGCTASTALAIILASHHSPTPAGGTVSLEDLVPADVDGASERGAA